MTNASRITHHGILYGVGVGPGDPELLTLKAVRALKAADVIAIPKSKEESDSIAISIVKGIVDLSNKETVELIFPMTKDKEILRRARGDAAAAIADRLKAGKNVACITLGDPMFYSTFSYLVPLVREKLPKAEIEIIPGISSVMASAAAAVIPLAEADERLAVIPATYETEKLRNVLNDFDTIVLMKVNKIFDKVLSLLSESGLKNRAVFVERCGGDKERVVRNLESLRGERLDYLSMVIVKK
ncbi:MAG: precorrin-2 C(20)-methyltransferase [Deltaproteobacteria bacterium]|nr:precorrin-2 C(20)-methyltransferase [Deltaproteobacteria bacterium]